MHASPDLRIQSKNLLIVPESISVYVGIEEEKTDKKQMPPCGIEPQTFSLHQFDGKPGTSETLYH